MPIDVRELEDHTRPLDERLVEHLEGAPGSAFSLYELIAALEGYDERSLSWVMLAEMSRQESGLRARYFDALENLAAQGKIKKGEVRGATYYAAAKA